MDPSEVGWESDVILSLRDLYCRRKLRAHGRENVQLPAGFGRAMIVGSHVAEP